MEDETSISMINENTRIKVSSVLNRDVKEYGKQFMFDGKEETCWNSDQGHPQYVMFDFGKEVQLKEIQVKFQGGFVGSECHVEVGESAKNVEPLFQFYPDDTNSLQVSFALIMVSTLSNVYWKSADMFH